MNHNDLLILFKSIKLFLLESDDFDLESLDHYIRAKSTTKTYNTNSIYVLLQISGFFALWITMTYMIYILKCHMIII